MVNCTGKKYVGMHVDSIPRPKSIVGSYDINRQFQRLIANII